MPTRRRRSTARSIALLLVASILAILPACRIPAEETAPPPPTFDVATLGLGPEAEVATFDVSVEGDRRPLRVVSVLWTPPPEEGAPPIVRWQFYSESFESPRKAYHVRLTTFFDLDPETLSLERRSRSPLTWEGGACCLPMERNAEGVLEPQGLRRPPIGVGPARVVLGQIPLLVRAVQFPPSGRVSLDVVRRDDTSVPAEIVLEGRESWPGPEGPVAAERIAVRYDGFDPMLGLEGLMVSTGADEETYWREAEGNHQLLGIDTARYGVPMTVRLRSETRTTLTAPAPIGSPAQALRAAPEGSAAPSSSPQGGSAGGPAHDRAENGAPEEDQDALFELDPAFLSSPWWDDGLAELAYYELSDRASSPGESAERLALSILVKHRVDPSTGSKLGDDADKVDALSSIFLYSLADSDGPVPVRRFFSGQARQKNLAPLTAVVAEVSSTDQCGTQLWLTPDARLPDLRNCHVRRPPPPPPVSNDAAGPSGPAAYLVHQMPLVIRSLALPDDPGSATGSPDSVGEVPIRLPDGRLTTATVRYSGRETLTTADGEHTCDRFEVSYRPPPADPWSDLLPTSLFGRLSEVETYWRDTGEHRQIVRMEADGLALTLIEEIRAPHWSEDFYPRLERVTGVP